MSARQRFKEWIIGRAKAARESEILYGDTHPHLFWRFFTAIGDMRQEAENRVDSDTTRAIDQVIQELTPDRTVIQGPFRGLQYGSVRARCSMLGPKLLGTYEKELFDSIELLIKRSHEQIIDVGSAEGYYSVGMALRVPTASIVAVDIDKATLEALGDLAKLNDVSSRLTIMDSINSTQLTDAIRSHRSLVISDCEGYESALFLPLDADVIRQADFLVECHDMFVPGITETLKAKFSETHDVTTITSTPRRVADAPHASALDPKDILLCVQERRPTMQWILATTRS